MDHVTFRRATRAELDALPEDVKGELIDGVLYTQPRPRALHMNIELSVMDELRGPFQRRRNGPGGWWILAEPGIQILRAPEFSPGAAGWRWAHLPALPAGNEAIRVIPDWVCEVLSPSNRNYDLKVKRRFYAEIGVEHLWYIDPEARTLAVSRLHEGHWLELGVYGDNDCVRAEPFDAVEIELGEWWSEHPPGGLT